MAFAPTEVSYPPYGDGSILGCFDEKEYGKYFEFSKNDESFYDPGGHRTDYPHKVWVTTPRPFDGGWRFAKVLKTVAYILTNDEDGNDVVEKWFIKKYREYAK